MNKKFEDLAFNILNNKIYGDALAKEIDSLDSDPMDLQPILYLKQFMESNYLALNSKNEETAAGRIKFAKEVYEDRILSNSQYYNQAILNKVEEVFKKTQKEFAIREF